MGRYVYEGCTGATVWKYWVAIQDSNQYLIPKLINVGEMSYFKQIEGPLLVMNVLDGSDPDMIDVECGDNDYDAYCDSLYLTREDIPKMKEWLKNNLPPEEVLETERRLGFNFPMDNDDRSHMALLAFYRMVGAYVKHMEDNSDIDEFIFEGEY